MRRDDESEFESGDDRDDDRDLPLEQDMDADPDEPDTEPCPHCRKPVVEDAEWCHHCGEYLSREDQPRHVPLWFLIGSALVALVVTMWFVML